MHDKATLDAYVRIRQRLASAGALPVNEKAREQNALKFLLMSVNEDEIMKTIDAALTDKWHGPRLLDRGIMYLRSNYNTLKALIPAPSASFGASPYRKKLNKLEVE